MLTKVARLTDRSVRYLEAGSGRALVLLHAFPLCADQWLPQLHRVPPGWRFVAPDLRGFHGAGPALEDVGLDTATMETHAADVLSLMSHLEIERAVIGGLSMGGYVALALGRRAPARVGGLVLANTRATADSVEGLAARDRMIALAGREGPAGVAREMLPKLLGETTRRDQPELAGVLRQLIERNSSAGIISAIRAMKGRTDSTPVLRAIACPTLIVAGAEDAVIPDAESETLHQAIPGATRVVIPRAGHLSNLEAPVAFNAALADFLGEITPGVF